MEKPHRFLIDRVSSYADEGGAFLRRRRLRSRPFVRIWRPGGTIETRDPAAEGAAVAAAAARLLDAPGD